GDGGHNPRHISHITINNTKFTTAFPVMTPQLGIRQDDSDYYRDTVHGTMVNTFGGSPFNGGSLVMTQVDLPGIAQINVGDHEQVRRLGQIGAISQAGTANGGV